MSSSNLAVVAVARAHMPANSTVMDARSIRIQWLIVTYHPSRATCISFENREVESFREETAKQLKIFRDSAWTPSEACVAGVAMKDDSIVQSWFRKKCQCHSPNSSSIYSDFDCSVDCY